MVFIIRHPCAVVASRLKLNWATDSDIEHFLSQKPLLEDFLSEKLGTIRNTTSDVEKHAIIWCVSNLVPLRQFRDGSLHVVFYENLLLHPEEEVPKVFRAIKQPYTASVFKYAKRASMTTKRHSAILGDMSTTWRKELSTDEIAKVLGIVDDFGLDHLYGDSNLPLPAIANKN